MVEEGRGEKYFHNRRKTLSPGEGGPVGHVMVVSTVHRPPERRLCRGELGREQRFRSRGMLGPTMVVQ